MIFFVIPGPSVARSPESITTVSEYGFRARRFASPRNADDRFRISRILLEPNAASSVLLLPGFAGFTRHRIRHHPILPKTRGKIMIVTAAHITPLVAIIAGILILIMPRLLNYIVAIYLIFIGLVGLNNVHHFINWH
jgi:hypothetical protein